MGDHEKHVGAHGLEALWSLPDPLDHPWKLPLHTRLPSASPVTTSRFMNGETKAQPDK